MGNKARSTLLLGAMLLGGALASHAQVSFGIRIGPPPRPRAVRVQPRNPGGNFTWVDGYWYPVGNHYKWHNGYYTQPPYSGARWVEPRYDQQQFYAGFWDGDRGRMEHDHQWDRGRDRDGNHDNNGNRGQDNNGNRGQGNNR